MATATPDAVARETVTVSGSQTMNTTPFDLEGDYMVTWSATYGGSSDLCGHQGMLMHAEDSLFEDFLPGGDVLLNQPAKASTNLYNLSGHYFVQAASGCNWSYTFTPY